MVVPVLRWVGRSIESRMLDGELGGLVDWGGSGKLLGLDAFGGESYIAFPTRGSLPDLPLNSHLLPVA
ncbi:MAG TPA: hypothetical protein DDY91_11310 [Planctomycetaceae bacterium]|nr:hypothetical protein [Planctomycetaceae bacterium]